MQDLQVKPNRKRDIGTALRIISAAATLLICVSCCSAPQSMPCSFESPVATVGRCEQKRTYTELRRRIALLKPGDTLKRVHELVPPMSPPLAAFTGSTLTEYYIATPEVGIRGQYTPNAPFIPHVVTNLEGQSRADDESSWKLVAKPEVTLSKQSVGKDGKMHPQFDFR